ncbi:hypothetical protein LEP1GSC125_1476 [Leptospira mayottensis 200901122]|uniref:Uncharacterized protein n=1 Tax=Leptospira mayottensis 200901122 TaxID=1193010 RepID=A0AA87MRT9_9LEPT|nr:hypothetical protein LEP1GSC125_1476 [Leptospira mayottensis 200901122]
MGVKIFFGAREWITQQSGFKRASIHWPRIPEERNKHPELICADALD